MNFFQSALFTLASIGFLVTIVWLTEYFSEMLINFSKK